MPDTKREILARIHSAIRSDDVPALPTEAIAAEWAGLPRHFARDSDANREQVLELFLERLRDYEAVVVTARAAAVGPAVANLIKARGQQRVLVPEGLAQVDLADLPGDIEIVRDAGSSHAELDTVGCVLTSCTVAIAETGTIVLQNAAGQGRRAVSLVPDYHICVVASSQVKATVAQAFDALQATASLPTTFISGPSATADIEMTRIKGVHGPRFLAVVLLTDR